MYKFGMLEIRVLTKYHGAVDVGNGRVKKTDWVPKVSWSGGSPDHKLFL